MKKTAFLTLLFSCLLFTVHAQNPNLANIVRQGINQSIQYTESSNWNEAFTTCRNLDQMLLNDTQTSNNPHYDLHYLVSKERLRMYNRIHRPENGKQQLDLMNNYATLSNADSLIIDYLYCKAQYYQIFGQPSQSLECYKQWFSRKAKGKDEAAIDKQYKDILTQAKADGNTTLASSMQTLHKNWKDSIQAAKDAAEYNSLKLKYADAQKSLDEKQSTITRNKVLLSILGVVTVVLAAGVIFLIFSLLRSIVKNKKLKSSLDIADNNNEMKSQFISHITDQVEPILNDIDSKSNNSDINIDVNALRTLFHDVQTYSALEESREEQYPLSKMDVSAFCENVMEEVKPLIKENVEPVVNAPKVFISTNGDALKQILKHLLKNAAHFTTEGKITLEFKKRSAHTGQFIVTDNGCGINQELRGNLFKPFKAIEDLREGDKMGLPICSLIAYKLNGELHLDDEFKKGTRFILELHEK